MKTCTKCQVEKYELDFYRDNRTAGGLQAQCKKCTAARSAEWSASNRDRHRGMIKEWNKRNIEKRKLQGRKDAIRKYWPSLTSNQAFTNYNRLLERQNGLCAICGKPEILVDRRYGKVRDLCVDHNHVTGAVRKLLCAGCNTALGSIRENFDTALNLARYIQEDQNSV